MVSFFVATESSLKTTPLTQHPSVSIPKSAEKVGDIEPQSGEVFIGQGQNGDFGDGGRGSHGVVGESTGSVS